MSDHWANVVVRYLFLSNFVILFIAVLFMAIEAYVTEKRNIPASRFESVAKFFFVLWFLNILGLTIFGILSEWFSLETWEIWAAYIISFLIGLTIWLISRKQPKEDRSAVTFGLLILLVLVIGVIFFIAVLTGRY